jgi:tRNA threonylcarbamoyladenosine biosynthesis protein TsaB
VKLLAFEAATRRLSVALWCDGSLAEKSADVPNGGSEHLLPWANALLADAGLSFQELDGLAFGAGPGGFTGLRLACGVTQGLASGLGLPVVPVGTLAALALAYAEIEGGGKVLACLDARMNEAYLAAYSVSGDSVEEIMAPIVGSGETVTLPAGAGWRGIGDGFATPHGDALRRRMGERLLAVGAAGFPTASAVARLAAPILAAGGGVTAAQALPIYVRDKVALTTAERLARGGSK